MTDKTNTPQPKTDTEDQSKNNAQQMIVVILILCAIVFFAIKNPHVALRVAGVLVGFGGIVMIHELGHFIVAKLGGIKVEAFSIGFPPVVLGIRKLKKGWRIRLLPKMNEPQNIQEGDNETEYQVGLFPIGGFVKMLGQSDTGAADVSDDPRSYANRPVSIRIATVAAGVVFNAIGAIIIFMILFMNGLDLPPAVVGHVVRNSPAADAGFQAGDEILKVNDKKCMDFNSAMLSSALSSPGEPVNYLVRRADGTEQQLNVLSERKAGDPSKLRYIGIEPAATLQIPADIAKNPENVEAVYEKIGLRPGDEVKAVNEQAVRTFWEYEDILSRTFSKEVTLRVSRQWPMDSEQRTMANVTFPMRVGPVVENFREESDLAHFSSLIPLMQVEMVYDAPVAATLPGKIGNWFKTAILRQKISDGQKIPNPLKTGDLLMKVADVDFPNYKQLRTLTTDYKDKDMPVTVLRKDEQGAAEKLELTVRPKSYPNTDRVTIGIGLKFDMDHPRIGHVLSGPEFSANETTVPAGAEILLVDGQKVNNFFEIASILQKSPGRKISVEYQYEDSTTTAALTVPEHEPIHARASIDQGIPFETLQREFKASNPVTAVVMGFRKVGQFISQSYVTIARLFQGSVSVSALSGPVGIVSMSYQATGVSLESYLYFLGLISSCLAVMNLLPLPVLDGGHIVILIIEKISGKPINERILAFIMYVGMALLLALVLWITYNDIVRLLFGN